MAIPPGVQFVGSACTHSKILKAIHDDPKMVEWFKQRSQIIGSSSSSKTQGDQTTEQLAQLRLKESDPESKRPHGFKRESSKIEQSLSIQGGHLSAPKPEKKEELAVCQFPECGKEKSMDGTTLKVCNRCKNQFYCSKLHQHAHWPIHKQTCIKKD